MGGSVWVGVYVCVCGCVSVCACVGVDCYGLDTLLYGSQLIMQV